VRSSRRAAGIDCEKQPVHRLLMCMPSEMAGGALSVVNDLVDELMRMSVDVFIASASPQSIHLTDAGDRSCPIARCGRRWLGKDSSWLAHHIQQLGIQVVHCHLSAFLLGAVSARLAHVPSVRTIHGRLDRPGMLSYRERIPFWICIHVLGQNVVAVSDKVTADLQKYYGLRKGVNLFEIANGCAVDDDAAGASPVQEDDRFGFVFVGRFEPAKGFPELLHAFRRLCAVNHGVRLYLVGDGPCKSMVDPGLLESGAIVQSKGWASRDEVRGFLRRSRVLVLPSHSEGLSITLLEAMSAGLVPLVSKAATGSNVVRDRLNGIVFETKSEDDLLAQMHWMASGDAPLPQYRLAAMASVARDFNVSTMAQRHMEMYDKLVNSASSQS
jgi:glycosyltransferase involved in cell wall biosynthesis